MKAVIPLAGKGTRFRPHSYVTPKPLLRVAGQPVLSYIMDELEGLGVAEVIFITGYLKEEIEAYIRRHYPRLGAHFVEQPVQNGTAGAVKLAQPFIDQDLLIVFVDTLFEADLSLIRRLPPEAAGAIWAKQVEDYQRFGVIVTDTRGTMLRIVEKPREPVSRLANIGLYYIRDWRLLFQGIDHTMRGPLGPGGEYYLTDAFQFMVDQGARIQTVEAQGWYDCGAPETLLETNRHLLETGRARRPEAGRGVRVHDPVRVAEGVELEEVELGPNVSIEPGCVIRRSALRDCIIGERTRIEDSRLHDSLVGNDVVVRGVSGRLNVADHSEVAGDG